MNLKSGEYEYLEREKLNGGMTKEEARQEIQEFLKSQTDFKDFSKEIKQLNRDLIKKDKQIEKLQRSNFSLLPREEKKMNEIKLTNNKEATVKHLNRILSLVEVGKISLSDISKTCILKPGKAKGALSFLIRNNLIKEVKGERGTLFFGKK